MSRGNSRLPSSESSARAATCLKFAQCEVLALLLLFGACGVVTIRHAERVMHAMTMRACTQSVALFFKGVDTSYGGHCAQGFELFAYVNARASLGVPGGGPRDSVYSFRFSVRLSWPHVFFQLCVPPHMTRFCSFVTHWHTRVLDRCRSRTYASCQDSVNQRVLCE